VSHRHQTTATVERPRDARGRFVPTGNPPLLSERGPGRMRIPVRVCRRPLRGRYDAAATTDNNRRHWANADALSADAAASAEVRRTLRNRARYEVANNSYASGIVLTLANDTVGVGPRLQLLTDNAGLNRRIEDEFELWATETGLAEKLRTMRMARAQDGEAFAMMANNPLLSHPIKLDLQLIEADQVASPFGMLSDTAEIDGIRLDRYGNPASYRVLRDHPGGPTQYGGEPSITVLARDMIHLYRKTRPGQHRGVPEIAPALPLFAQLRRFTLAVLAAAESAAEFAGILFTDAPPNGEADAVEPMDLIELERNMLLTMPGGWKMSQLEPAQPATTYAEFKKEILNEIARCLNMPFNIAAGNSSGYNYASGRLDHQTYFKSLRVDQAFLATDVLDRVLSAWLWEYALAFGLDGGVLLDGMLRRLPLHQWFWDGMEHVDPSKEARAQDFRLRNHTTTLAIEYAKQGLDWEPELRQRAKELKLQRLLGMTEAQAAPDGGRLNDERFEVIEQRLEELHDALALRA
jgi:lambda family phage portal protein